MEVHDSIDCTVQSFMWTVIIWSRWFRFGSTSDWGAEPITAICSPTYSASDIYVQSAYILVWLWYDSGRKIKFLSFFRRPSIFVPVSFPVREIICFCPNGCTSFVPWKWGIVCVWLCPCTYKYWKRTGASANIDSEIICYLIVVKISCVVVNLRVWVTKYH